MDAPAPSRVTPARIIALALIGLVVLGLGYARVTRDTERLSVPAGAQAGDLITEPCTYQSEDGPYPADCGTLVVSEDPADERSRLIALPVTRVRATADDPQEPVFYLTGGPGGTNMAVAYGGRYVENRDVVLVGYRGVDGSVRLECPEVESAIKRAADLLSEEFFQASDDAYRACADRLTDEGLDPTRYGLVQQVDDLEAARVALGYERINLLSESAGTRTAMIYAWQHPERIHRSVMVGVNPPGNFLWYPGTTDEQIDRYAARCADDASCSSRTDDLSATLDQGAADVPDRWLFLPIKDANVRFASMLGLFESTTASFPISAPMVLDAWLAADEGDASGLWFSSVLSDLLVSGLFVRGQYASAAMLDAEAARDYFADGPGDLSNLGVAATASTWAGGRLAEAWPATSDVDQFSQVPVSQVETLLISGELDVSTPPQIAARELLPSLPNGHEVVLTGFGHTGGFFAEQPDAGTHLVNTYLDSGQVDDSLYQPLAVDFTPPTTLTGVATVLLRVMLVVTAIAVLSLVWMTRHVRTHDGFGPVAGALLRSLHPVLLGVGGWFLAALVVLATMPAVTLDNELLAILGVCPPIALGIHTAWTQRAWPARTRAIGVATAVAGALIGGWLGFHAGAGGFVGLVFAIVGAIAGANLSLILFDISRAEPTAVLRIPETTAGPPLGPPSRRTPGRRPPFPDRAATRRGPARG